MALTINTQRLAVDDVDFSEKANSGKAYSVSRKPVTSGLNGITQSGLTGGTTTGWSTNGTVAVSTESGLIKLTGTGGSAPNGTATVALDTIPGNYYLFNANKNTSTGVGMTMSASVGIPSSPYASDQKRIRDFETITNSYTDKRIQFQAVSDITYLNFTVTASATSAFARLDHISLIDVTLPNNLEVTSVNGRANSYNYTAILPIGQVSGENDNSGYTVMSDGFVKYLYFPSNDLVFFITNNSDYGVHGDGSLFIEGVLK